MASLALVGLGSATEIANNRVTAAAGSGQTATASGSLDAVLTSMDKAAATFKAIQCDFTWDQYTKVVDQTDTQTGTVYFRRLGPDEVEMAAHIEKPAQQIVLYQKGTVRIYTAKDDTEQRYDAGKNKEQVDSFLMLGFGGRGHDLDKKFTVEYAGTDAAVNNAAKLVLTPKDEQVAKNFSQIILWIDTTKGISIQQKFIQPKSGDYRLAKYANIQMSPRNPDTVFKMPKAKVTKQ